MPSTCCPGQTPLTLRALHFLFAMLVIVVAAGCQTCKLVRVHDGVASCEREVEPKAYTAFAHGRLAELQGNRERAKREYERVIEIDGRAAEAWVRLAVLACRSDPRAAERAWGKALELAADSHTLWFERARCALESGDAKSADVF